MSSKRRRISEHLPRAPAWFFSLSPAVPPATTVEPKLDEIQELIMVELQKDDDDAVVRALCRMMSLTECENEGDFGWRDQVEEFFVSGAFPVILLTMRKWSMDKVVQDCCCGLLARLMGVSEEYDCMVVKLGGVEAVLTALQAFPESSRVAVSVFTMIRNLFACLDLERVPYPVLSASRRFVKELNGLEMVKDAMTIFAGDVEIQARCCELLLSLAHQKEFHKALLKSGTVTAVCSSLERHLEKGYLKKTGSKFMKLMFGGGGVKPDKDYRLSNRSSHAWSY
jgi:hypothetical protein